MPTAAHIHDTLIAANSWASTTWNWLMGVIGRSGDTLVDIVGSIWTGISSAIALAKSAASALVDIVKAGLEFISNAVIGIMLDVFKIAFLALTESILKSIVETTQDLQIQSIIDGFRLLGPEGNVDITIERVGYSFKFSSGANVEIFSPFDLSQEETLSIGTDEATEVIKDMSWANFGIITALLGIGLVATRPSPYTYPFGIITTLVSIFTSVIFIPKVINQFSKISTIQNEADKNDYIDSMRAYNQGMDAIYAITTSAMGLASLAQEAEGGIKQTVKNILSNPLGNSLNANYVAGLFVAVPVLLTASIVTLNRLGMNWVLGVLTALLLWNFFASFQLMEQINCLKFLK